MLRRVLGIAAAVCLFVGVAADAWGRDLFIWEIEVAGRTEFSSTNSFLEVGDLFSDQALEELFGPDYSAGRTGVAANLDLRGVAANLTYFADGNPEGVDPSWLVFEIPSAGIRYEFDGTSRDQSESEFQDWLEGQAGQGEELSLLLKEFTEFSPVDPVAGNPNSLESRILDGDFDLGGMGPFLGDFPEGTEDFPNLWKVDFNFGYFGAGPYSGESYELDLAFGWNPSRRLSVLTDLAFMFSVVEGEALTGIGHFGLGLQARMMEWWNLSLVARGGIAASVDVGAVGAMYSVSLVSHLRYPIREYWFEMRNMVGVANSIDGIEIEGLELNYDLTNVVLKNGISINREFSLGSSSRPLRASLFFTQTGYFVDELWLKYTHELGLGIGLIGKDGIPAYGPLSLDASYVFGDAKRGDYDALKLKLSLRF